MFYMWLSRVIMFSRRATPITLSDRFVGTPGLTWHDVDHTIAGTNRWALTGKELEQRRQFRNRKEWLVCCQLFLSLTHTPRSPWLRLLAAATRDRSFSDCSSRFHPKLLLNA